MKSDFWEIEPGTNRPRPDLEAFGRQLKQRREAWGMSQAKLAQRAGTTQAAVSAIEAGRANPTFDTMSALAHAVSGRLSLRIDPARRG